MSENAALEVEIRHLTEANERLAAAVEKLAERVGVMEQREAKREGFIAGAKWVIGLIGAGVGALGVKLIDWVAH